MTIRRKRILLSVSIFLFISLVVLFQHYYGVILNIPKLMGQPVSVVERTCGVPVIVSKDRSGIELRKYSRPIPSRISYDANGKVIAVYIDPHAMYGAGLRYSKSENWMSRFGFSHLLHPTERTPWLTRWRNYHGLAISIGMTCSGDSGGDIGGDEDDAEVIVRLIAT